MRKTRSSLPSRKPEKEPFNLIAENLHHPDGEMKRPEIIRLHEFSPPCNNLFSRLCLCTYEYRCRGKLEENKRAKVWKNEKNFVRKIAPYVEVVYALSSIIIVAYQ